MENVIILPTFGIPEDELRVKQFEELFPRSSIATVNSIEIANDGGIFGNQGSSNLIEHED